MAIEGQWREPQQPPKMPAETELQHVRTRLADKRVMTFIEQSRSQFLQSVERLLQSSTCQQA